MKTTKINDLVLDNETDENGDLYIKSPSSVYDDRYFYINKKEAICIIKHFENVFNLKKDVKTFSSKRHDSLSEYLTDIRADRLDEWQMDEVISYVKELEKLL